MTISNATDLPSPFMSSQQHNGKYSNTRPNLHTHSFGKTLGLMWKFLFNKPKNTVPNREIPVLSLSKEQLMSAPDRSLFRLGHSTILLKLRNEFWLTDPVFSERASPVQWIGPKRFHQPPISIADLPPIKGVILSHNHYDHLDYHAVIQLKDKVEHFLTPLGVGDTLIKWGVPAEKVQHLTGGKQLMWMVLSWLLPLPIIFQAVVWVIATQRFGHRG